MYHCLHLLLLLMLLLLLLLFVIAIVICYCYCCSIEVKGYIIMFLVLKHLFSVFFIQWNPDFRTLLGPTQSVLISEVSSSQVFS